MSSFAKRVVLITGAGSGIGRQLALTFAREGALIAAVDLQGETLAKLSEELPPDSFATAAADVTDRQALGNAIFDLQKRLGPIEVLIASAGVGFATPALFFRAEEFETIVRVNLLGMANSIEAVLPGMLKRRSGHLVGMSSLASYRGLPQMAGYCASKAGVNAMLDSLRIELKPYGIRVTTICPGWIKTAMTAQLDLPEGHVLSLDEAVAQIVTAIRQGKSFHAFPAFGARRVRLLRWLPCAASDWLVSRVIKAKPRP